MRPEKIRKSLRFQCLSPGGHFAPPWLILGPIFARLGALSGLIVAAGGPKRLQNETNNFQKITKIPMFVARWSFWPHLTDFGAWAPFLASLWSLGMLFLLHFTRSGVFLAFRGHCHCNFRSILISLCTEMRELAHLH